MSLATHHIIAADPGFHTLTDSPLHELWFGLARVEQDRSLSLELGSREAVLVPLEGGGEVKVDEHIFALPVRNSVFESLPAAVFAPSGSVVEARGPLLAGVFMAAPGDVAEPDSYAVMPDEIAVRSVGRGNYAREVRDIIPQERSGTRLLVGETINPPGNWSSSPPHKHDREAPPDEAALEEVYCYRVWPVSGFGLQHSYSTDPKESRTFRVHDLEVVAIPGGYHPVVAAPGHRLYYLWGLAGGGRELRWFTDPAHRWVDATPARGGSR